MQDNRQLASGASAGKSLVFSFGDPTPVLAASPLDYIGTYPDLSGAYYRPPVDLLGLARTTHANGHHNSTLLFKRDMIINWLKPTKFITAKELKKAAQDYLVTGNAYFQVIRNRIGGVLKLLRLPAVTMRAGIDTGIYYQIPMLLYVPNSFGIPIKFQPGEVIHIAEPDVQQAIYGIPQYFGGLQSILLAEDATLFKRKYFLNGNHMGYILVTSDAGLDDETAKAIEEKVKDSKGPGNFRSLYINIPRTSSREPVKIIPVGDIGSKEEFDKIKAITERDVLAMHRMQPGLAGIIPENTAGFGNLDTTMRVYHELEVRPLQNVFKDANDQLGIEAILFDPPNWAVNTLPTASAPPGAGSDTRK
jgi:PBSX family phage portal protein